MVSAENDRGVDEHEEKHELDRAVERAYSRFIAATCQPPIGSVEQPESRKRVVDVDAAAPIKTCALVSLASDGALGRGMVPGVNEVKRQQDVNDERGDAKSPHKPSRKRCVDRAQP